MAKINKDDDSNKMDNINKEGDSKKMNKKDMISGSIWDSLKGLFGGIKTFSIGIFRILQHSCALSWHILRLVGAFVDEKGKKAEADYLKERKTSKKKQKKTAIKKYIRYDESKNDYVPINSKKKSR